MSGKNQVHQCFGPGEPKFSAEYGADADASSKPGANPGCPPSAADFYKFPFEPCRQ